MRSLKHILPLFVVLLLALSNTKAAAQTLHLRLGGTVLHFPSANPSTTLSIPATENPLTISIDTIGLGTWVVTMLAGGDLQSGADSIPISNLHWMASGSGFMSGTVSKIVPQNVAAGIFTNSSTQGTLQFTLDNSWTYPVGTYTQALVLTAVSL